MEIFSNPSNIILISVFIIGALITILKFVQNLRFKYKDAEISIENKQENGSLATVVDDPISKYKQSMIIYGEICCIVRSKEYYGIADLKNRAYTRSDQVLRAFHSQLSDLIFELLQDDLHHVMYAFFAKLMSHKHLESLMLTYDQNHLDKLSDNELEILANQKYEALSAVFLNNYTKTYPQDVLNTKELRSNLESVRSTIAVPKLIELFKFYRMLSRERLAYIKKMNNISKNAMTEALNGTLSPEYLIEVKNLSLPEIGIISD